MEPSPLTQDTRPEIFQPKIISLYETLFKVRPLHLHPFCANQVLTMPRKTTKKSSYPPASGKNSSSTAPTPPAFSAYSVR